MRELVRVVADLALPATCPGCGRSGTPLCHSCHLALQSPARSVAPQPVPEGWPGCWSTADYDGPAARVLRAFKDGDRRDLAEVLGRCLGRAVDLALVETDLGSSAAHGGILVVPAPSAARTRRARGDLPVALLARRAVRGFDPGELRVVDLLSLRGTVRDQGGLGEADRRANLHGSMAVRTRHLPQLRGRVCLVVDDVVTSGSTLTEAARALAAAGAVDVVAATALAARRRSRGDRGAALPDPATTD